MTSDDEPRLVAGARSGDARAFSLLVDAHQQAVRGFLRRHTGHWSDADDLAQEAFLMAWSRLDRYEGRAPFRAWVCGIGYRMARDARRARVRAEARDTAWLAVQDDAARAPDIEDNLALARAMATLPEAQRAAIALVLGEGFSHNEAAEALSLPLGTVKSHVTRGREKLLHILETRDGW